MPQFTFRARSRAGGKLLIGDISAANVNAAADKLLRKGFIPSRIEARKSYLFDFLAKNFKSIGGLGLEKLIIFTTQLASLLKAGIPIVQIMDILSEQENKGYFRQVLADIKSRIEDGVSLNESMREYPLIFPETYTSMVIAGEISGTLDQTLERLVKLLERELETANRIREALRYPTIVAVSIITAVITLMTFVVPKFSTIFTNAKIELPLATRTLITLYGFLHGNWPLIFAAFALSTIFFYWLIKNGPWEGKWHYFILKVPITGAVITRIKFAQFCGILSCMVKSGIPILKAIDLSSNATANKYLETVFGEVGKSVQEGTGMTEPLRKRGELVPHAVIQMISAGEASGKLDEMLERIAGFFNKEAEREIKNLSAYIEPVMVFLLGSIILFIALSIFLPIWDLTKIVHP